MTFDELMNAAVQSYAAGTPVVIMTADLADLDKGGYEILHGVSTLTMIRDSKIGMNCTIIAGVPEADFFASDYPRILEEARQKWLGGKAAGL